MTAIDEYVRQVMELIPPVSPEYGRIELDLRSHLEETSAAEGSGAAAIGRMGTPREVALGYLADVPQRYASFLTRVAAFVIDVLLGFFVVLLGLAFVGANAAVMTALIGAEDTLPAAPGVFMLIAMGLAILLASIVYFPVLEWRYGQTLGKKLMGIHVIREDGSHIGLVEAVVRRIPFFLEFFWIDALVALFTERHQRAFDFVARTVVVECTAAPTGLRTATEQPLT